MARQKKTPPTPAELIAEFEALPWPEVDRDECGWNQTSRLLLAEQFIAEMGLDELYSKFLDTKAHEELSDT